VSLVEGFRSWRARRRERLAARRVKGPKDHVLREIMETVATAVIMAIVVRHFVIEAFQIPTESMSPTLYGVEHGGGAGDRILVNKYPLYVRGPKRWEITVFRYPLDSSTNFVKRLVGMPGELLELRDGNVWVDGRIERKPPRIQKRAWRRVTGLRNRDLVWNADERSAWKQTHDGWSVDAQGVRTLALDSTKWPWDMRRGVLDVPVSDWYMGKGATGAVGDIRLSMTCRVGKGDGVVVLRLEEYGRRYEVVLGIGGESSVGVNGDVYPLKDVTLENDEEYELAFANVDDAVELQIDGDTVFRHEYDTDATTRSGVPTNAVEIDVRDAKVTIEDLAVDRDIHYCVPDGSYLKKIRIPPDRYVMLGDNSSNSRDSRVWSERVFLMKDGTVYRSEMTGRTLDGWRDGVEIHDVQGLRRRIAFADMAGSMPRGNSDGNARIIRLGNGESFVALISEIPTTGDVRKFVDATGVERVVAVEDLVGFDWSYIDHAPFVTRKQIVGEAFFVFWPGLPPSRFRIRFL
jgi:signal peptidase I